MSFDFNVSYSSCLGYSLINTLKLKKKARGSGPEAVFRFLGSGVSVLHSAAVGGSVVGVVRPL